MSQNYFHILSDGIVRNIYHPTSGFLQGASYQELNKQQLMDLLTAKKEIVEQSRKDPKKVFYLDVDIEGEVSVVTTFTKNQSCYAYRNGSEIALPDTSTTPEPKANKRSRVSTKPQLGDVPEVVEAKKELAAANKADKDKKKPTKSVTEGISSTKTTAGAAKPKKSMATKTKAKKSAKKAATKTAAKKAPATKKTGMPEGKRMTITVKKALELAKKGAYIYRASNGSPFGQYYLEKVKNKDHAMDLIVRQ